MNGSISLLRANPSLTTNIKLVVDTQYNLYFESYSANRELSDKSFKKYQITADSFLSQKIAAFYKGLPTDIAFDVKNDINPDVIQSDYNKQFDDIYYSGGRNVEDTRYLEEFQYNTTLKIVPNNMPKYFMVFRVDGPGTEEMVNYNETVAPLDPSNTTNPMSYISSAKLISTFDLTPKTNLGRLWKKNYIDDDLLLRSPVEFNFKQYEFSKWNGYDYHTGGTVSKSLFMNEYMLNQTTPFDIESFITDGFKKNSVVSSHFTNISFLYDDTVAGVFYKSDTPGQFVYYEKDYPFITKYIHEGFIKSTQYTRFIEPVTNEIYYTFSEHVTYRRKWTINRYTGFYIDELIGTDVVSPYVPVQFEYGKGIYIVSNVFRNANTPAAPSVSPVSGTYNAQLPVYFKIDTQLFLVEFQNNEYVLISDTVHSGMMDSFIDAAQKPIKIEYENDEWSISVPTLNDTFRAYIKNTDNTYYQKFEVSRNINSIYVIKIVDRYYRIGVDAYNNRLFVQTDDYITCDSSILYRKLGFDGLRVDNIQVLTKDNDVTYFQIYKLKLTEIGDWDFTRENTTYAGIEYNKTDSVSHGRPFLFQLDVKDTNVPKDHYSEKYYNIWVDDQIVTMSNYLLYSGQFVLPQASEYAASGDLYMLDKMSNLTRIWNVNQSVAKWGIYQSINNMSVPYSINNSLDVCGPYNFTPNMYSPFVDIKELTLDWFYTLGKPVNYSADDYYGLTYFSGNNVWNVTERTLNIDLPTLSTPYILNPQFRLAYKYKIDMEYYKNPGAVIDYFDYVFNQSVEIDDSDGDLLMLQYYKRIAYFTESDRVNGPAVFFKGLSASIQYVDTADPNTNSNFKVSPANDLSGYGFSILFSPRFTTSPLLLGKAGIEIILNKIYNNVMINMYVYTLPGTYTSLCYKERDRVYNDSFVQFTGWADPSIMSVYTFYDSELPTQSLTLKTITDILSQNMHTHPHFSQGIKYTVVENVVEYPLESITCDWLPLANRSVVTLKFLKDIPLKHGDWIFIQNTTYAVFDTNLQIDTKKHNRSVTVVVDNDQTTQVGIMNNALYNNSSNIKVTKEKSVYPFRLKVNKPDNIKINRSSNMVAGDTSCPVKPRNTFSVNTDIIVSNENYYERVPYVYVDDNISRRLMKSNTKELPHSVLDGLPSIFRYSADYEPILNTVDMFKQSALTSYNNAHTIGISMPAGTAFYMESDIINNKYHISVHVTDVLNQLYDNVTGLQIIAVGDALYVHDTNDFPWAEYRTGHVIAVSESTLGPVGPNKSYKITLSFEFTFLPILTDIDFAITPKTFRMYLFKYSQANTAFEYQYANFGKTRETMISKVYTGVNPLQTSNQIWKTTNKYPMIDEHGMTTISRNLFKSSWDPNYYYKTISKKHEVKPLS